jgi:NAD(P)-dependent dehydrogenase (short-subunit alcohol dehydrogenase family)
MDGKVVLVTGGNTGIGKETAVQLAQQGATVGITSRDPGKGQAAVADIQQRGNTAKVELFSLDLGSFASIRACAADVLSRWDRLDVLVNNAGATWGAPLDDFPVAGWDKVFDVNVRGVFLLTTQLLGLLRAAATAAESARVIVVGSVDGLRVPEMRWENYPYSASKAAVHMLARHLGARLAGEQITVNAIAPGFFASNMTAFLLEGANSGAELDAAIPLGRIGRPDDIAGTVRFLASRAGAYLTGSVVVVDGGVSLGARVGP